jgi:hypothetical protein
MAHSVVFSSVPNKCVSFPGEERSPFEHWLSSCGGDKDVLFSSDIRYGLDITEHMMFVPDKGGDAGDLLFVSDAANTYVEICARVLIDKDQKQLYFANAILHFEHHLWNDESKQTGGLKVFKRDYQQVAYGMVNKFFGVDWRFHMGFKKKHHKSYAKRHRRLLKALYPVCLLPLDMQKTCCLHRGDTLEGCSHQ